MSLRSSRVVTVALVMLATFTDIVAYSVAVPVLPDLSRRLGASPTMIGLLFASFGVTLLGVSMPMGAVSDRIGRKAPLVGGLIALAVATLLFAFAEGLLWLFAARLVQGAADAVSATMCMLDPVLPLFLSARLGLGPARIGFVFGISALVSSVLHPLFGRLADRSSGRRLTIIGLVLVACGLPWLSRAWSYPSAIGLFALQAATMACVITPSLAYMAEAVSQAGVGSFGVAYGLYNVAWGVGLLGGPALGGFLFERMGFAWLALLWSPVLVVVTVLLAKADPHVRQKPDF